MASKAAPDFPVVLSKKEDGKTRKRTAHSQVAYNQLITEGYTLPRSGGSGNSSGSQKQDENKSADAPKSASK